MKVGVGIVAGVVGGIGTVHIDVDRVVVRPVGECTVAARAGNTTTMFAAAAAAAVVVGVVVAAAATAVVDDIQQRHHSQTEIGPRCVVVGAVVVVDNREQRPLQFDTMVAAVVLVVVVPLQKKYKDQQRRWRWWRVPPLQHTSMQSLDRTWCAVMERRQSVVGTIRPRLPVAAVVVVALEQWWCSALRQKISCAVSTTEIDWRRRAQG